LICQGRQELHRRYVIAALVRRYTFTELVCGVFIALRLGWTNLVSRRGAEYGKREKAAG
jgi:hypothetical protein